MDDLSRVLDEVIASLDVPPPLIDDAVSAYGEVASWLGAADSPLRPYKPDLYPQGSFRLGTPIRPLKVDDDFDVDLVCRLDIQKELIRQAELKQLVGTRLRKHPQHGDNVSERRRCWTVNFETRFHLDVLPAIPDPVRRGAHILLTDRELTRWQHSNPIGYAEWFYARMEVQLKEARDALAKSQRARVEDIPAWRVRTPLQRAVQLLKRHRDVRYRGPEDHCPISIIITTLAARAYQQEPAVAQAIARIVERIPGLIERRDGKWWIPNPAHPDENFADKWNEEPARRDAFLSWHRTLKADVERITGARTLNEAQSIAESLLSTAGPRERLLLESSVPDLESLSHLAPLTWPLTLRYRCSVQTAVHRGLRGKFLWLQRGRLLHKKAGLRFEATTDAPPPYEVVWQVANTGSEARRANKLRGGFERGDPPDGRVRWETTLYRGTHVVEAFIVKDGAVVARSGQVRVPIS